MSRSVRGTFVPRETARKAAQLRHRHWPSLRLEELEDRCLLSVGADIQSALDGILAPLSSAVSGEVFGVEIPIVGSALKNSDTAKFLTNLQSTLDANASTLASETDVTKIAAELQSALGLSAPSSVTAMADTPNTGDTKFVIHIDQSNLVSINTGSFKFDVGLPGLGLKTTGGGLNIMLGYTFNLDFVVPKGDPAAGIYFTHDPNHDFSLTAKLALANNFSITGTIGFLQVDMNDGTFPGFMPAGPKSGFTTSFNFDLPSMLSLSDAANAGTVLADTTTSISGEAKVNLGMVVSFGGSTQFPTVSTNFQLDWKLDSSDTKSSSLGSEPTVDFNNVTLDLGTFFSQFVGPILSKIQTVTKPLQPVIDFVTAPIPVISNLAGHNISLLDLAQIADPSDVQGIAAIIKVVSLINEVPTNVSNVGIQLGNFDLGSKTDVRTATQGSFDGLNLSNIPLPTDILTQLQNAGVSLPIQNFVSNLMPGAGNAGGLSFPILDDPGSVFGLFINRPVNLFKATLPDVNLAEPFDQFFSIIGPLGVELKGTLPNNDALELKTHLEFGYDTYGLTTGNPLDGFFVENASVTVAAGIEADLELNLVVAKAGVGGGITGTVTFTLHDPDAPDPSDDDASTNPPTPKIRADEIATDLQMGAFCIFDVTGTIDAFLHAFVSVGFDTPFGFVGWSDDYTIADVKLTFSSSCNGMDGNPQPTLGHVSTGSGEDAGIPTGYLILDMGPFAHDRGVGDTSDDDESFSVTHTSGSAGNETVQIAGEGSTQQFSGVKGIWAEGGDGNNTITIKPGVVSPATIYGGFDTTLHASDGMEGNNVLTGGDGTTFIQAGPMHDQVHAGKGNTTVMGGGGGDTINGGAGNDYIDGVKGNNDIYGGTGVSTLKGGSQSSTSDVNLIVVGTGDDTAVGGNGPNIFVVNDPTGSILASHGSGISITGSGAANELILNGGGGSGFTETYNFGPGNGDGNIVTTNGTVTQTINYTGLAPIFDTVAVDTLTVNATTTSQILAIDGTLNLNINSGFLSGTSNLTEIRDDQFEPAFIAHKTTVDLIGNDGGNTVFLDNLNPADGLANLNVTLGNGTNTVNVESTGAGVTTTVDGTKGNNTFNVGLFFIQFPNIILPTVDSIKGNLVLKGDLSGGLDTLNVDDIGSTMAKTGTLTPTTISGLNMGGTITYTGMGFLNIYLGSGGNTFSINDINPLTVTKVDGGTSNNDSVTATFALDFNGSLTLLAFEKSTIQVTRDFNGFLSDTAPGSVQQVTIGRSLTATGKLIAGSIDMMTVGLDVAGMVQTSGDVGTATIGGSVSGLIQVGGNFNMLSVGQDVSGSILVTGTLNQTSIGGSVTVTGKIMAGAITTMSVGVDVAGLIAALGNIGTLAVGHSVTYLGIIQAGGDLNTMTVGPPMYVAGDDMAGQIIVGGTLGSLRVAGATPGNITAGHIGTVAVYGSYGPYVLQIKENGIQRRVEVAVPANPYPLLHNPPQMPLPASPAGVTIQYFYEGLASALHPPQPCLTARVTNTTPSVDEFDLSLTTWSDTAKFDLSRLDANGAAGIRNVAVEGDVLTTVSAAANNLIPPSPAGEPAGVYLPADALAGVGVSGNVTAGAVQAASIQALGFGSLGDASGTILGTNANQVEAQEVPTASTPIVEAKNPETFRIPFAGATTVAFFFDSTPGGHFDNKDVLFTDQGAIATQVTGLPDIRGAVTALVTATVPGPSPLSDIQTIALNGDGGAIQTSQDGIQTVTSTGPLGDVIMQGPHGLVANVTAPCIIGNIIGGGGISGTVQTTGLRTDPITGVVAAIAADFGRALTDGNGNIVGVTTVQSTGAGLGGQLISRANFKSQIIANGGISAVVAGQGDFGVGVVAATGHLTRFGSVQSNGPLSGDFVFLGNIFADFAVVHGGLKGGRIAAQGQPVAGLSSTRTGILGNLTFSGDLDGSSAIVSGGMIGDPAGGTGLSTSNVQGILAADETITVLSGNLKKAAVFQNATGLNSAAIASIFVPTFDQSGLDLKNLNTVILPNLNNLHVSNGSLTTAPPTGKGNGPQKEITGTATTSTTGTIGLQTAAWSATVGAPVTLGVYVANPDGTLTADEHARIDDAINTLDQTWTGSFGLDLVEVTDPSQAAIIVSNSATSPAGGQADGVLGCTTVTFAPAASGELDEGVPYLQFTGQAVVNILEGWNWYTGSDPAQIGSSQYDYLSVVTHELGHSVGLYHDVTSYGTLNGDGYSAMYPVLSTGQTHRQLSPYDISWLNHLYAYGENPGGNDGPEAVAALMAGHPGAALPVAAVTFLASGMQSPAVLDEGLQSYVSVPAGLGGKSGSGVLPGGLASGEAQAQTFASLGSASAGLPIDSGSSVDMTEALDQDPESWAADDNRTVRREWQLPSTVVDPAPSRLPAATPVPGHEGQGDGPNWQWAPDAYFAQRSGLSAHETDESCSPSVSDTEAPDATAALVALAILTSSCQKGRDRCSESCRRTGMS